MATPKWVATCAQPIYIGDVIEYLVAALELDTDAGTVYEIGGADKVSYMKIMEEYASLSGKTRVMIPVPVLTPWLSSLWLGLVTPLQAQVGRKLIEGVRNESVVKNFAAIETFDIKPLGNREAIKRSLE